MRRYNQQIEDAYAASRRHGDMMRDRQIERSSGQDRTNRYRSDRSQFSEQHGAYDEAYQGEGDRVDLYGYERSMLYNSNPAQRLRQEDLDEQRGRYPETYRSAMSGYASEHVGRDLGRQDYNRREGGNLYGMGQPLHRGKGPKNYTRSDDRILEDINDRLTDDPDIDASDIEVKVQSCEVMLTGNVHDRNEKRRAEDIAESISGVRNIENRLRVQSAQMREQER